MAGKSETSFLALGILTHLVDSEALTCSFFRLHLILPEYVYTTFLVASTPTDWTALLLPPPTQRRSSDSAVHSCDCKNQLVYGQWEEDLYRRGYQCRVS